MHVCVCVQLPELGQGQKAAALIEMVRHQNKEMNKADIMKTCEGPVFLNNVLKQLFHDAPHLHTRAHIHIHVRTTILPHFCSCVLVF